MVVTLGEEIAIGIWWLEARDAAKVNLLQRIQQLPPHSFNKESFGPSINDAEFGRYCYYLMAQ